MKALLIMLCLGLFFYFRNLGPQEISRQSASALFTTGEENAQASSCQGKSRCVVVYMAPWCGACVHFKAQLFPAFKEVLGQRENVGLRVIIGRDAKAKIESMGADLGVSYESDPQGKYYKELGVRGVPSFLVLDPQGKIHKNTAGFRAQGQSLSQAASNFLDQLLK